MSNSSLIIQIAQITLTFQVRANNGQITIPLENGDWSNQHQLLRNAAEYHDSISDYSPACSCVNSVGNIVDCDRFFGGLSIICNVTSSQDYADIRSAFDRSKTQHHNSVTFTVRSSHVPLPPAILGSKSTSAMHLYCSDQSIALGAIATDAFASSAEVLSEVTVDQCDMTSATFDFLLPLKGLNRVVLQGSTLSAFQKFPPAPTLSEMHMINCFGIKQWYPPLQVPGLTTISIVNSASIDDETVEPLLNSFGTHQQNSLYGLYLSNNSLTRVPMLSAKFSGIDNVDLSGNPIEEATAGRLNFSSGPPRILDIHGARLKAIEQGALLDLDCKLYRSI